MTSKLLAWTTASRTLTKENLRRKIFEWFYLWYIKSHDLDGLYLIFLLDIQVHGLLRKLDTWGWHSALQFSSVQSLSCVLLFETPWTTACQASLSIANSWSLSILMSIESVMLSNHLILDIPLFLFGTSLLFHVQF